MINMFAIVEMNGCILNLAIKNPAIIANTVVSIEVDGKTVNKEYAVSKISNRQSFLLINGLEQGKHTLKLTVVSGNCSVDAAQVLYDYEAVNKAVTNETSYVTIAKKKKKKD